MTRETREYTVVSYDELTPEQQKKAIGNYIEINIENAWWTTTYEDAENIGLKLDTFDLERRHIMGSFLSIPEDTAKAIIENHGSTCTTYVLAKQYMRGNITNKAFLSSLLKSYLMLLQEEYNYRISEEAIAETLIANNYMFDLRTLKIDTKEITLDSIK